MADNSKALTTIDPNVFLTFNRLDDDQIIAEMKGAALTEYVYEFSQGGQTVRGLSKVGTDDASRLMAVKYGEALREIDAWLEKDDEEAAYFKALVKRFIVKEDGTAIEMDSAIGHKRQSKKVGGNVNLFWYEQGGQKALRNAKQKLMPETIKQAIIKSYIEAGKVRKVTREDINPAAQAQPVQTAQKPQPTPERAVENAADKEERDDLVKRIEESAHLLGKTEAQLNATSQSKDQSPKWRESTLGFLRVYANFLADEVIAKS